MAGKNREDSLLEAEDEKQLLQLIKNRFSQDQIYVSLPILVLLRIHDSFNQILTKIYQDLPFLICFFPQNFIDDVAVSINPCRSLPDEVSTIIVR